MWVGKRGVRFGLPVIRPELRNLENSPLAVFAECIGDVSTSGIPAITNDYSYLKESIGLMFAARRAGT